MMDTDIEKKIFLFQCTNCKKLNGFFSCNLPVNNYCKFCLKYPEKATCDNGFSLYKIVVSPFFIYTIGYSYKYFKYGILIKPSKKNFYDYTFNDNLHIGIVDENNGIVFSFWNKGVIKEYASVEWLGSVKTFNLIKTEKSKSMNDFLNSCGNFFEDYMYNCSTWNCFDFVLAFLNFYGYPIRLLSKEVFIKKVIFPVLNDTLRYCRLVKKHMAEFLESDGCDDSDRLMDMMSFNREQFRIFKEVFRDNVEVKEDIEYDDNVNVFDYVTSASRKKIINLIMKIEKIEKKTNDDDVRVKASQLLKQLRECVSLIPSADDELNPDDLDLKKFDEVDINLLLGEEIEEKEGKVVVSEALSKYKKKCQQELENLLNESEIFIKCNRAPE